MIGVESFDDFLSTDRMAQEAEIPPFQFREDKSEEGTLKWLVQNFENCEKASHSRRITYRRYQALYKNIQWRFFDSRDTRRDFEGTSRNPKHSVNFVHEMVEARVAQNSRMRANLAFIPHNDEQSDTNNAKACKVLYDAFADCEDLEGFHQKTDRSTFIFGHSAIYVGWDPDKGPIHPKYQELMAKKPDELKKLKDGPIHVGDVCLKLYGPDRFYVELNKRDRDSIDHIEFIDYVNIHELKAKYPKKKMEITENKHEIYDFDSSEMTRPKSIILVRTFYHIPTPYFPEGCKIVYCDDAILEWTDFPYADKKLPVYFDTDVDVYGEFWGRSFIMNIEQMQRFYNNIQSSQARDFSFLSAPKWLVPKGGCNVHSLNNDITVIEWTGPTPPSLVHHPPTPPQGMEMQERLEKKIAQHSGVYDISRGESPPGVTANSALRFLDEQESQRSIVSQYKRKKRVIEVAKLILSRMQQFYKASDGRTVRILGKNNEYFIKSMEKADFTRIYDIKIQNSSALPDTKAGKISTIIDLNTATQTDPIFRKEEIIEMLELGNDDYFKDRATVAVDAANTALQALLEGEQVAPPDITDDLLVHYNVFTKAVQQFSFKNKTETPKKEMVKAYIKALEALMFERAKLNMKFAMELANLNNFPMLFKPEMPLNKVIMFHQMDAQVPEPPTMGSLGAMNTSKIENMTKQQQSGAVNEQQ